MTTTKRRSKHQLFRTVTALALFRLVLSAMTTGCVPDPLSRGKGFPALLSC